MTAASTLTVGGSGLRADERRALRNAMVHAGSFEDVFTEMFGPAITRDEVVNAVAGSTAAASAATDALTEVKDAIIKLTGAVERLEKSNANADTLAKVNTVLQFSRSYSQFLQ